VRKTKPVQEPSWVPKNFYASKLQFYGDSLTRQNLVYYFILPRFSQHYSYKKIWNFQSSLIP